ncbi:MAG: type I-E CRISPR-associated protein Cse1/CasA [Ignavibacteriae bacterium]|nr:type I-E CRISPR-associated protein Cse1/CasA [Ignavibacteriota bacterium]MCB9216867.1 type I-E CRISPR-associated protein Cse1/CasA [Ignavibacteria bacterium]
MNLFDDQRFLIRSRAPDDDSLKQLRLSWKKIMTSEFDYRPRFDYSLEYMNVAALGLLIGLTQAFFEPETIEDIPHRLEKPLSEDEFEAGIAPHRSVFGIDDDIRFMQGTEPETDAKGRLTKVSPIGELLLSVKRGDKEFLNRPATNWGVCLDQIPLLLFSRSTFYEKSAGRGYLTGTTGDLEIRTFLIDPNSLRRTIWLNVLAKSEQSQHFKLANSGEGYDDWMWNRLPKTSEVPAGDISLRSGLFWTVANLWVDIQEVEEPHHCLVSGEIIPPGKRAGRGVVVNSTGIAFGATVEREDGKGARQSFFRHPNAPYKHITPKNNKPDFTTHIEVHEKSGLIGEMGGLFYATGEGTTHRGSGVQYYIAPVLEQLAGINRHLIDEYYIDTARRYDLFCFGFHMLSSKKNVHGGYESELFSYPLLGTNPEERKEAMTKAETILNGFASTTHTVDEILCSGVQMCVMEEIDLTENDSGIIQISQRSRIDNNGPIRDASRELWKSAGMELNRMVEKIGDLKTAEEIGRSQQLLMTNWTDKIVDKAIHIFNRYFNDAAYSRSADLMLAAHNARRLFNWKLAQMDAEIFERRKSRFNQNNSNNGGSQ